VTPISNLVMYCHSAMVHASSDINRYLGRDLGPIAQILVDLMMAKAAVEVLARRKVQFF
jgi:hypothetical protein